MKDFPQAHEGSTFLQRCSYWTKRSSLYMCLFSNLLGLDPHQDCKEATVSLEKCLFGSWHTNKHIMLFMCANLGHFFFFSATCDRCFMPNVNLYIICSFMLCIKCPLVSLLRALYMKWMKNMKLSTWKLNSNIFTAGL